LDALWTSLIVAAWAMAWASLPGFALGWLLARKRFVGRSVVEGLVQLPLVVPAVAVGYGLLWVLGRQGWALAPDVLFTRAAASLASGVMALPLIARMAQLAFEGVDARLEAMARTSGLSRAQVMWSVTLPLARRGLMGAFVLGFARALGEFGATVVVAGLVPGETRTLALGIFEELQLGHQDAALSLAGIAAVVGLVAAITASRLSQKPSAQTHRPEPRA
jgi:molybdate transport system permease protein